MRPGIKDISGKKFGKLTALRFSHIDKRGHAIWEFQCDCEAATVKALRGSRVAAGQTSSCGCAISDAQKRRHQAHRNTVIGTTCGRLTILNVSWIEDNHTAHYDCVCVCGNRTVVSGINLKSGGTTSCGCYAREVSSRVHSTHGLSGHPLYTVWLHMNDRCSYDRDPAYHNYGGRGISVCPEWAFDLRAFIEWAESNGYEPGLTIDREDNDGNYEPSNCRWVTPTDQARNTRRNVVKDIQMARNIRNDSRSNREIANHYDIPTGVVQSIKVGRTWAE